MAAINKPQPPNPANSADTEARQLLRAHQAVGVKPNKAKTLPSNGAQGAKLAGRKVGGGASIRGGRG
jgi:hypothetical protein